MINFVSTKEMRILEENSEFLGVSKAQLMENAGKAAFEQMRNQFRLRGKKIVVVCGQGNNGGDGFVVARHLSRICKTAVVFVGDWEMLKAEAQKSYQKLLKTDKNIIFNGLNRQNIDLLAKAEVLVDAMLGTGVKGRVKEPISSAIGIFNRIGRNKLKIALDLPSGLDSDTGKGEKIVKADWIYTFHRLKQGLKKYKRKVKVLDIGIPKKAKTFIGLGELKECLHERNLSSHKGENGRVLIIGGSREYVGASALAGLAAMSALRAGVDIVNVAAPEKVAYIINGYSPDLITTKLEGNYLTKKHLNELLRKSENFDVVLVGNGIGRRKETQDFVKELVKKCKKPMVLNADAIKAVKGMKFKGKNKNANVLLTPHAGEFEIYSGKKIKNVKNLSENAYEKNLHENMKIVQSYAKQKNCVILLKGKIDIISDGKKTKLNETGNVRMTVGGTGDVLAGICTAFVALGNDLFTAASAAAFLNGLAGDRLLSKRGQTFIASDIFDEIPKLMKELMGKNWKGKKIIKKF